MLKISLRHCRTALITVALAAATLSTGCAINATEPLEDDAAALEDEMIDDEADAVTPDELEYVAADQDESDELARQSAADPEAEDVRVVAADSAADGYGPGDLGDDWEEQEGQINPGGPVTAH